MATNELLEPRIEIQKANNKCKYDSGYICGDATSQETHELIQKEIDFWKANEGLIDIDVVFATPPCQGMSTVNYKKTDHEQKRNSLVVGYINLLSVYKGKHIIRRGTIHEQCLQRNIPGNPRGEMAQH